VSLRIGIGVDAHAFAEGIPLVLAGVRFEHPEGLAGHSDGDVIAHALTDAILGAAGLGDIGSLFPSGDERFRGAVSIELLREAHRRDEMRRRLSDALDGAEVNVRATTTDELGFTGRGEGLAAEAVALLESV
jgi:2-C-methyl-D-erythritol 2,4-cyclodiphosphate synthase